MIEVFKTNIDEDSDTNAITQRLLEQFPLSKINFDLEDCDKILRIESSFIDVKKVILLLNEGKFQCVLLE
jgi:hypothetical protein